MKVEQDVMAYGVEQDNAGCYFIEDEIILRKPEKIENNKEFCDCSFRWKFTENDAHGVSIGKTLPAYPTDVKNVYPRKRLPQKMRQRSRVSRCWGRIGLCLRDRKVL